ncbi:MAG: xylulokinase [Chloroflexota bacterium]|nr:MAG: hypothetical protein DLM70_06625 [Chloroflexota bacterium]
MRECYIGLDVGSTAVKAAVLDGRSGEVTDVSSASYQRLFPSPGRYEIEPEVLRTAVIAALSALPQDVKPAAQGLGVTGQMAGVVFLDRHARTVGRCISIFDTRAVDETAMLEGRYGDHLARHEANHALTIYTLPKILWLREHEEDRFHRTWKVVLPKDWIRGVLIGEWATEPSDASGTLTYDQFAEEWDEALLRDIGLSSSLFPDIIPSHALAGRLTRDAADATGLPLGLPVVAGAADMAAVPVGVGGITPRSLVVSLGSAAHVIAPTDALEEDIWPVQQYTQAVPHSWYRFGAVFSGGLSLEWFLGNGGADSDYGLFDGPRWNGAEGQPLFMPYLAGAGAPHYLPEAAGAFLGLRTSHTRRDMAQAVLEGVALEVAEVCQSLDLEARRDTIHVTGGASRVRALVEILAALLERPLMLGRFPDAAARGAAVLAWKGVTGAAAEPDKGEGAETMIQPDERAVQYYRDLAPRYRASAAAVRSLKLGGGKER